MEKFTLFTSNHSGSKANQPKQALKHAPNTTFNPQMQQQKKHLIIINKELQKQTDGTPKPSRLTPKTLIKQHCST
jgi:hypothetical protein